MIAGAETEFAVLCEPCNGSLAPLPRELASALIEAIVDHHPHLPAPAPLPHQFLAMGGCVYVDRAGFHPETCTAECARPEDLAAQQLALRQMLRQSADEVSCVYGFERPISVFATNVDHHPAGAHTFGYHVNFGTSRRLTPEQIEKQLTPLLVAGPLLHGTGKLSFAHYAPGFEISQRASFMFRVAGKRTTVSRSLITNKDESLAGRDWRRVHVICLDTPVSGHCMMLMPAMMGLAIHALEKGTDIGTRWELADPMDALRRVSADLTMDTPLRLRRGEEATALQILRGYADASAEVVDRSGGPDWAPSLLALLAEILTNLSSDPYREIGRLDWPTKLSLLNVLLEDEDTSWEQLSPWLKVIGPLRAILCANDGESVEVPQSAATAARILPRSAYGVLDSQMGRNGLDWQELPRFFRIVQLLCRADILYHRLGEDGLQTEIASLAKRPLAVTQEAIERAMTTPPADTRARARGAAIQNAPPNSSAWWTFVQTPVSGRLQLDDPYGQGCWVKTATRVPRQGG